MERGDVESTYAAVGRLISPLAEATKAEPEDTLRALRRSLKEARNLLGLHGAELEVIGPAPCEVCGVAATTYAGAVVALAERVVPLLREQVSNPPGLDVEDVAAANLTIIRRNPGMRARRELSRLLAPLRVDRVRAELRCEELAVLKVLGEALDRGRAATATPQKPARVDVVFQSPKSVTLSRERLHIKLEGEDRCWLFRQVYDVSPAQTAWEELADRKRAWQGRVAEHPGIARGARSRGSRFLLAVESLRREGRRIRDALGPFGYCWVMSGERSGAAVAWIE